MAGSMLPHDLGLGVQSYARRDAGSNLAVSIFLLFSQMLLHSSLAQVIIIGSNFRCGSSNVRRGSTVGKGQVTSAYLGIRVHLHFANL